MTSPARSSCSPAPSNPSDAYSLLREAIASPDPVVFLEPKKLYWAKGDVALGGDREPGIGTAVVRRQGTDATLIAYGPAVPVALEAAFGRPDEHTGRDVPPLVLQLARSGEVALAGFIDRVDRSEDGAVIAYVSCGTGRCGNRCGQACARYALHRGSWLPARRHRAPPAQARPKPRPRGCRDGWRRGAPGSSPGRA